MLKKVIGALAARLGRPIRDERTGQTLGRAIVLSCLGQTWLIGLHHPYVRAIFLPQARLKYARHQIGFATHPPVDYPSLVPRDASANGRVLWAILFHQSPEECARVLEYWKKLKYEVNDILLVHGGRKEDFTRIAHPHKVYVPDQNLRTRQHPVEKQSYSGPLREIAGWLKNQPSFQYVSLVEYDHLPLVRNWHTLLRERMIAEKADVLFHHLTRVDGTNAPHYLYHLSNPKFSEIWPSISLREDHGIILNCMATGSFWNRAAFAAVAATPEATPIYLEMYLPTQAHHLGFRVRDYQDQNDSVHFDPLSQEKIHRFSQSGAWALHPVKNPETLPVK